MTIALTVCAVVPVASATPQPFTQRGTATVVVDPVTLDVSLVDGTSERVQLIGLQPPAAGSCALSQATADLGALVSGKPLWLLVVPGKRKPKRVVTAYAILPGGGDVGVDLVRRGDAKVAHGQWPFKQLADYTRAQKTAQTAEAGLWGCSLAPAVSPPPAPPGHDNSHGKSGDNGHGPPGKS
jgi:micrococcal nuclease